MAADQPIIPGEALRFPPDFTDETPFFRQAVARFLKETNLPDLSFEELAPSEQSKIIGYAMDFKAKAKLSSGHEGANRE